jgi:hypothetical protein
MAGVRSFARVIRGRSSAGPSPRALAPADPRDVLPGPLDPTLEAIRAELAPFGRRLWLRRFIRRASIAAAGVLAAELVAWTAARLAPIELTPALAAAIPVLGLLVLIGAAVAVRPTLGEAALAADAEGSLGDRVSSALALAVLVPSAAGPAPSTVEPGTDGLDEAAISERLVRRQRADALRALRSAPRDLFRPRVARRPAIATLVAAVLLVPAIMLPNPQDVVIAENRQIREEATRQAERLDEIAQDLESKGATPDDPRTRLAKELRELARQLRDRPADLDANLARLGSIEGDLRAQLDPANEQRAASLASLSRALSRTATGRPDANAAGDPKQAAKDLEELARELEELTQAQQRTLAAKLSELQSTAGQADGAAGAALRDAAQSLAQGDTAGARAALDRLGEALGGAEQRVATNRDLSGAASRLQDARRDLANSGRRGDQAGTAGGQGQSGSQGNQGQQGNQGSGSQGGQQGSQGGQQGSQGGQQGSQGQQGGSGQSGQGQGQGQGSLAGGGSNARYLGSGTSGAGGFRGPTGGSRPATVGEDLETVYAPFDRLGKPGDPSYVSGTGGEGQIQGGTGTGQGQDNGAFTPYQQVYADFYRYALTSLDRSYVPLSVKDYVRDYFSSLDPSR